MKIIHTNQAPAPVGPYSQAIKTGNLIFCSGQIALDNLGNFHGKTLTDECQQIFKNIDALLSEMKLDKKNIVKVSIFLLKMEDFAETNKLYSEWLGDHKPARSCVAVAELPLSAKVEIEIIVES
jgi:2-iminobutanoate/2-iminopropanoate deaminase